MVNDEKSIIFPPDFDPECKKAFLVMLTAKKLFVDTTETHRQMAEIFLTLVAAIANESVDDARLFLKAVEVCRLGGVIDKITGELLKDAAKPKS